MREGREGGNRIGLEPGCPWATIAAEGREDWGKWDKWEELGEERELKGRRGIFCLFFIFGRKKGQCVWRTGEETG